MSTLKRNECKRQCRYNYTTAERLEKGRALADEYGTLDSVNSDLERVKKDFKARIETHEAKIALLAEQTRSGYELRETLCLWVYNEPKPGRKTLCRADTIEIIGEEDMTGADTQMIMDELDAQAAAAAEANKPLALPVVDLPLSPWPGPMDQIAVAGSEVEKAFGSARFAPIDCAEFATLLHRCFYLFGALSEDPLSINDEVSAIVASSTEAEMIRWLEWLEERSRPGGRMIANILRSSHGILPAEQAPEPKPAKKTPGRKARTASNGVVATEADGDDISNPDDSKS